MHLHRPDELRFGNPQIEALPPGNRPERPREARPRETTDSVSPRRTISDEVEVSPEALDRLKASSVASDPQNVEEGEQKASSPGGLPELTPEQEEQVRELQARDREVRAHEQAHKAAAGSLAIGGPTYSYQTGPDGRRYAVGGEVRISIPDGRTPEETARIARQAQRAALAPAEPSEQDRKVAREAAQKASEAQREARIEEDETDPSTRSAGDSRESESEGTTSANSPVAESAVAESIPEDSGATRESPEEESGENSTEGELGAQFRRASRFYSERGSESSSFGFFA